MTKTQSLANRTPGVHVVSELFHELGRDGGIRAELMETAHAIGAVMPG